MCTHRPAVQLPILVTKYTEPSSLSPEELPSLVRDRAPAVLQPRHRDPGNRPGCGESGRVAYWIFPGINKFTEMRSLPEKSQTWVLQKSWLMTMATHRESKSSIFLLCTVMDSLNVNGLRWASSAFSSQPPAFSCNSTMNEDKRGVDRIYQTMCYLSFWVNQALPFCLHHAYRFWRISGWAPWYTEGQLPGNAVRKQFAYLECCGGPVLRQKWGEGNGTEIEWLTNGNCILDISVTRMDGYQPPDTIPTGKALLWEAHWHRPSLLT